MSARTVISLVAVAALAGCSSSVPAAEEPAPTEASASPTATPSEKPSEEPTEEPSEEPTEDPDEIIDELTIVSGGDVLIHSSVWEAAAQADGGYDFTFQFAGVEDWIAGADLALCSLEVPIAPEGEAPSNYPLFGAPDDLIPSLKAVGFDGCNLATNHTMDRGFPGITRTVDLLEANGMGWHGGARSAEEFDQTQFYVIHTGERDVNVAHISASTLTNGLSAPTDKPWAWYVVGDLGPYEAEDVIEQARQARANGADLVVVSMHWGTEYVSEPIPEQVELGQKLADSGEIDLVYGNHSHVPEPVEKLPGGPNGDGMWVVWSMGNMLSGQRVSSHGYRVNTGILATATVEVPRSGPAHVERLDWTAITQDSAGGKRLFPLSQLRSGEVSAPTLTAQEIEAHASATYPVMDSSGPERTEPPTSSSTVTPERR